MRTDADLVFCAHLLTCVDKGRLCCARARWAVTACLAKNKARTLRPPSDLVLFSIVIASCLRVSLFEVGKKEQQMVVAVPLATYCLPQRLPSAPASSLYEQGF